MGETNSQILYEPIGEILSAIDRIEVGVIEVPEGLDGRVRKIRATAFGTLETVVVGGGKVEIENDAIGGMVCKFAIGGGLAVTEGGGHENPAHKIPCDYPLIGGSTFVIYYTPYDDQDQTLQIELEYERDGEPDETRPNYIDCDVCLKASAISQVTVKEDHNQIKIPKLRGGILLGLEIICFPTGETVVNAGGKAIIENTVKSWKPFEFIVGGLTVVGASGGGQIKPQRRGNLNKELPGNSRVDLDYTPYDNQSQSLALTLLWRGKDPS